jgi:hypothetical protein
MPFKDLLDSWGKLEKPQLTEQEYAVKLSVEDAARLHALADLHPDVTVEHVITDLLAAALDELEAAMPYVAGDTVIREDDHGDPVYEDVGLTPKFLELVRAHQLSLQSPQD